jgi:aminoglycoside 6'-N-acetyltransferase
LRVVAVAAAFAEEETVSVFAQPEIAFRRLEEADFPLLAAWLAEPHVRRFYQKKPITLEEVAREYESPVRGREPTICSLAEIGGAPFAYLQCYRNTDYPEWADLIGAADGISVDLFIGDPACLHRGLGQAALSEYLGQVAFAAYPDERCAYIAHEGGNAAALRCSEAVGFRRLRMFDEDGVETVLLRMDRPGA